MLTRASARASGAPAQRVDAVAERRGAGGRWRGRGGTRPGRSNWRGSRFAAPFSTNTVVPGGEVDAADRRAHAWPAGTSPLSGPRVRSISSMNVRDAVAVVAQQLLELGVVAEDLQRTCRGAAPSSRCPPRTGWRRSA